MKPIRNSRSLVFKSGVYSFISFGVAMLLMATLFLWVTEGQIKKLVKRDNEEQIITLVRQFDQRMHEYYSELKQKSSTSTMVKAVMSPDNTTYYLSDYIEELSIGNLEGDFTLLTFDGVVIESNDGKSNFGDKNKYYKEFIEDNGDTEETLFLDLDMNVVFVSSIKYNDYTEGYLIFVSKFSSIFIANKYLFESRENNRCFSALYNNKVVVKIGKQSSKSITSIYPLKSLPVTLQVATNVSIIRDPVNEILSRIIIFSLIAVFLLTILFSIITSINMIKPLTILEKGVVDVGAGFIDVIPEIKRESLEVQFLRDSFNSIQRAIKEKNADLEYTNVKLQKINSDLQKTQKQLVLSEKMASIGQLAAGVAHEINNPTGFVTTNLHTMSEYLIVFKNIFSQLNKLTHHLKGSEDAVALTVLKEIERIKEDEDYDFIYDDSGQLLEESIDGVVRIKDIVNGLRNFARPDSQVFTNANINDGIEDALRLTSNELKYSSIVNKELGVLPEIPCHIDQLTQVFVNLLVNAAHAIEKNGVITIKTWDEESYQFISVTDNGAGIPEENIPKLFDPFYTTKEVGKGTGLGLAISYGIIEKHGGDISVESSPGEGTSFTIKLKKDNKIELDENDL